MNRVNVLLVAAEGRELRGVLRRCRNRRRLNWPLEFAWEGELDGAHVWLAAGGHGQRLAGRTAETALRYLRPDVVVSVGFCGALDPALQPGQVLVPNRIQVLEDGRCYEAAPPSAAPVHAGGTLLSCDRVVTSLEEKSRLRFSGATAVDMEAAAVAAAARAATTAFCCVKAVTDLASEPLRVDFNAARDGDGRIRVSRVLAGAIRRPWREFPELVWLYRRCRLAAERLGDFLGCSRF
jgi:adenosylhomocysteine nucleosidase